MAKLDMEKSSPTNPIRLNYTALINSKPRERYNQYPKYTDPTKRYEFENSHKDSTEYWCEELNWLFLGWQLLDIQSIAETKTISEDD